MRKTMLWCAGLCAGTLFGASLAVAEPVKLDVTLSGAEEPNGGDLEGTGHFSAEIDSETGDLCYTLIAQTSSAPTAAHIHKGAAGKGGPIVVNLDVTGEDNEECAAVPLDTASAILGDLAAYHVNVHTGTHPKGAIRGQLSQMSAD